MKNIKKSIIQIGFSVNKKNSGKLIKEINIDNIKKLNLDQKKSLFKLLQECITEVEISDIKRVKILEKNKTLTLAQKNEIYKLIKNGRKLGAVKFYKEITGIGLKESKDFVDSITIK